MKIRNDRKRVPSPRQRTLSMSWTHTPSPRIMRACSAIATPHTKPHYTTTLHYTTTTLCVLERLPTWSAAEEAAEMAVLGMQTFFTPQAILQRASSSTSVSSASASVSLPSFSGLRPEVRVRVSSPAIVQAQPRQCADAVASLEDGGEVESSVSRRNVLAATSALSLASLLGGGGAAVAEDSISDWEQVFLPINPGVVLLDLAFVPDQPERGQCSNSFVSWIFWMNLNWELLIQNGTMMRLEDRDPNHLSVWLSLGNVSSPSISRARYFDMIVSSEQFRHWEFTQSSHLVPGKVVCASVRWCCRIVNFEDLWNLWERDWAI